jgi:hypothetical protein
MTFEEAKVLARKGVKVTHEYFTSDEYMTMRGNMCIFEDGTQIMIEDWSDGKDYLLDNWSIYEN